MNREELLKKLSAMGAIITGSHLVYASGKHGHTYINKDELYTDPDLTYEVCGEVAALVSAHCRPLKLEEFAVISPAVGGVALSQHTTRHLKGLGYKAVALYADKEEVSFELDPKVFVDEKVLIKVGGQLVEPPSGVKLHYTTGRFVVKRGYDKKIVSVAGKNVIVVEDILTTGGSVAETIKAVRAIGGNVVMTVALANRGGVTAEMIGSPHLDALLNVTLEMFDPAACPLCAQGVPINTSVGHGKAFLERQAATTA